MFFDSLVASELQKRHFQLPLQIRPHNAMIDTNVADGQSTVSCWDATKMPPEKLHQKAFQENATKSLWAMVPYGFLEGDQAISHTIFVVFFSVSG